MRRSGSDLAERIASAVATELAARMPTTERWRDKRELADYYSCGVRSIEAALAEGMPHKVIFGRVKCRISQTDSWLREHGYLRDEGGTISGNRDGAEPLAAAPRLTKGGISSNGNAKA